MAETFVNVTEGSGKKLHAWDRTVGANTVLDELVLKGIPHFASYNLNAGSISTATANSHLMQLMAGASLPVYVTRVTVHQFGLATTGAFGRLFIVRLTSAGTGGTAVTPAVHDGTDAASGATGMTLPTVKGTEAATPLYTGANAFMQTVGAGTIGQNLLLDRDFDRLVKPIRIPAGTTNGIAIKCIDAIAAATVQVDIEFMELSY